MKIPVAIPSSPVHNGFTHLWFSHAIWRYWSALVRVHVTVAWIHQLTNRQYDPRNTSQWNSIQSSNIFIRDNAFENVVCKMSAVLFRSKWVTCKRSHTTRLFNCCADFISGNIKKNIFSWWRHKMETFPALLALCAGNSPVTGEFLSQRPVTRSFDVFFDLRLNKRLSKQSWRRWFETP